MAGVVSVPLRQQCRRVAGLGFHRLAGFVNNPVTYSDGYYWATCPRDGTSHVVYREAGSWWVVGIDHPIDFDPQNIIAPIATPQQPGMTIH